MKLVRSSKIHFRKWLTLKKKNLIKDILHEYSKIVNYFIKTYEYSTEKKTELLLAKYI